MSNFCSLHTLSAKGPTRNCDLSICFGRASFVDQSKHRHAKRARVIFLNSKVMKIGVFKRLFAVKCWFKSLAAWFMLRVERGEVKALVLFILSCRKRVWIKDRHVLRVGVFCLNKWSGGGGGGEWITVFA